MRSTKEKEHRELTKGERNRPNQTMSFIKAAAYTVHRQNISPRCHPTTPQGPGRPREHPGTRKSEKPFLLWNNCFILEATVIFMEGNPELNIQIFNHPHTPPFHFCFVLTEAGLTGACKLLHMCPRAKPHQGAASIPHVVMAINGKGSNRPE